MTNKVKIVEIEKADFKNPVLIEGLPDVGLVGTIATSFIVDSLGLREIAYVDSPLIPPAVQLKHDRIIEPVTIYGNEKVVVLTSFVELPLILLRSIVSEVLDWITKYKPSLMLSIGGIGDPRRIDLEKIGVVGITIDQKIRELIKEVPDVNILNEGVLSGPKAIVIREANKRRLPFLILLSQAFPNYPDPGAAAAVIDVINRLLKLEIDVKPLLEKADEIKVSLRELMKKTISAVAPTQSIRGAPTYIG